MIGGGAEAMQIAYWQIYREYNNYSQSPDLMILSALSSIAGRAGKGYAFPSQDTLCNILDKFGRKMSRRTLNRHLNSLVRAGWIKRTRRHQADPVRGMTFRSTLYTLTRRSLRWLKGLASAASRAVKSLASFVRSSRVPNLAQYNLHKIIIAGPDPEKTGPPPAERQKGSACGGPDKKKALAELARLKSMLA